MKNYKIIADPRVKLDLQDAMEFLKSKRKDLDSKFLSDYKKRLSILKTSPFFEIRYDIIRCLPLETFKYMIHFTVNEQTKIVHIYGVISTYLNPEEYWLKHTK
ncbi:hypothetical protein [Flavobacterium sp.]|uniref:hypothetical protein n=1 Tax=Flavobacterium sp. TaxID=239 RepID=UPI00286DB7CD|nr:hypothetical protein [Flavobacterium sp.]